MSRRATVKVKKSAVTRAEAVAEFSRKKARQRRKQWHRRVMLAGVVMIAAYIAIGSWWLVHTGRFDKGIESAGNQFWQMTAGMGFKLDQIHLSGRKHADVGAIKEALAAGKGTPILSLNLTDIKVRLEAIPEIDRVMITRTLPNSLTVQVTERVPTAWWQTDGKLQLIDREGVILSRYKYKERMALPVVVGADAPKHMNELAEMLDAVPSLKPDVTAAIRIGARRWNIELARNITVMLPEEGPTAAWKRFAGMVEHKALLSKAIRHVDMRMEDRVFIQPIEQNKSPITFTSAREI